MSASSVKVRKDLSADGLISMNREGFDAIPDTHLRENQDISLSDALMSACAMFSLKDPSLLAFDERRRDPYDNFRSIYGIQHVPCDTQMRTILDPVDPKLCTHCTPGSSTVCSEVRGSKSAKGSGLFDWVLGCCRMRFSRFGFEEENRKGVRPLCLSVGMV